MVTLQNRGDVIIVTKDIGVDQMNTYVLNNGPEELTEKEQTLDINIDIKKEEVKACVREMKILRSNLKKMCSMIKVQ